jgi:hypothetical protein
MIEVGFRLQSDVVVLDLEAYQLLELFARLLDSTHCHFMVNIPVVSHKSWKISMACRKANTRVKISGLSLLVLGR